MAAPLDYPNGLERDDPSLLQDQDSDGYWDQALQEAYDGVGPIMWGLAVALVALLTYGLIGAFG